MILDCQLNRMETEFSQDTIPNNQNQTSIQMDSKSISSKQKESSNNSKNNIIIPSIPFVDEDMKLQIPITMQYHLHKVRPSFKYNLNIKIPKQSIFYCAKQIYIPRNFRRYWSSNLWFNCQENYQKANLQYISTVYTETNKKKFRLITYLTSEKIVIFQIEIYEKQQKYKKNSSVHELWSYLSVYHHENPFLEEKSLMQGWTQQQFYSFWLVRSYALDLMLFRLQVTKVPKLFNQVRRIRYWHFEDQQMISLLNARIIKEFQESGNWIQEPPKPDPRFAAHNQSDWFTVEKDWSFIGHQYMQDQPNYKKYYDFKQFERWSEVVLTLYRQHIYYHRVQLWSSQWSDDKVIFRGAVGAIFPFIGQIAKWSYKRPKQLAYERYFPLSAQVREQQEEIDHIIQWIESER